MENSRAPVGSDCTMLPLWSSSSAAAYGLAGRPAISCAASGADIAGVYATSAPATEPRTQSTRVLAGSGVQGRSWKFAMPRFPIGRESPSTTTSSISNVICWPALPTVGRTPLREVSEPPAADVARSSVTVRSLTCPVTLVATTVLSA